MNTTENIIKQDDGPKGHVHVASTEYSTLKKGQRVTVKENPLDSKSREVGVGVLTKCNDTKVYLQHNGYENWNVKFESEEQSRPRIVHARDIVAE